MAGKKSGHGAPGAPRVIPGSGPLAGLSRRDFLNGVLIGASALATSPLLGACEGEEAEAAGVGPGTLPLGHDARELLAIGHAIRDGKGFDAPPASGELYDCLIVGSGVAGLTAAWRLGKLGVQNFLLLEKEPVGGGHARAATRGAQRFASGAAYTVYPFNDALVELYTDLGVVTGLDADDAPVVDPKYVVKGPTNNVYLDGRWIPDAWDAGMENLPLPQAALADLLACREAIDVYYNYVGADDALAFDCPTDASTTDEEVRRLDTITFAAWVEENGWDPAVTEFFEKYARSALGMHSDTVSAWGMLNFLGSEFYPVMTQPGGNAYLADLLTEKIGADKIKPSAFVVKIVEEAGEVHVTYVENGRPVTLRARSAIYAAASHMAQQLIPGLAAAGRTRYTEWKYTAYLLANVHVSRTPPGLAYDNWVNDECFFTDFVVADWAALEDPANAPLDRPNTLTIYAPLPTSSDRGELLYQPYEFYEEKVLTDLERVLPGVTATITGLDLFRWGHPIVQPRPGFIFGEARAAAQAPLGAISFAAADVDGLPAFENAVAAAYRSVDEALAVLAPA